MPGTGVQTAEMERIIQVFTIIFSLGCIGPLAAQTDQERKAAASEAENAPALFDDAEQDQGIRSKSYYLRQQRVSDQRLEQSPTDADAWLDLYKSTRFAAYSEQEKQVEPAVQVELDNIVQQMQDNVPNTFETNYATYWNSTNKMQDLPKLEAANQMAPQRSEIYDELIGAYEMKGDAAKKKQFSAALDQAATIPAQVFTYNKNTLNSVEAGGYLITNGYDDTYPAFIEQEIRHIRPDIKVLQLELLQDKSYRDRITTELGIPKIQQGDYAHIVRALIASQKPIYFSLTLPQAIILAYQDNLYLTGLALRYSGIPLDNASTLKANWEKMDTEHLKHWAPTGNQRVDGISRNYLLPLTVLEDIYASEGEKKKAKELGETLDRMAGNTGKQNELKKARAINTY